MDFLQIIIFYFLLAVSVIAFFAYGIDKYKAKHGKVRANESKAELARALPSAAGVRISKWRTSEATLLWLAVLGGSVGAWLGMRVRHHKTMHKKLALPRFFLARHSSNSVRLCSHPRKTFEYGVPAILLLQRAAVVAVLCLTSCNCGKTTTESRERPTLIGGYTKDRALTKEEMALFDKAYKGEVALRPVSVAMQVVAGTNYAFLCKDKSGNKYKVVIYQPLPGQGEARVTSIKKETE